jgi:hypothetical protein
MPWSAAMSVQATKRRAAIDRSLISPVPIPFELAVTPINDFSFGVVEDGRALTHAGHLVALLFLFLPVVFVLGVVGRVLVFGEPLFWLAGCVALACLAGAIAVLALNKDPVRCRVLSIMPKQRLVRIEHVDQKRRLLASRVITFSDLELVRQPVTLELAPTGLLWNGLLLTLHLDANEQVVLACVSDEFILNTYIRRLPSCFTEIRTREDGRLRGRGILRAGAVDRLRI